MIFNTFPFALFAVLFFLPFFILSRKPQLLWLLGASCFFYAWWDWRFCFLMLFCAIANYGFGLLLSDQRVNETANSIVYHLAIAFNLVTLGIFKYFDFFVDNLSMVLDKAKLPTLGLSLNVVLPIGISFYTFHSLSYIIDIKRGKITAEKSILTYVTYIALWPQLVAGPIVRASRLLPQLRRRKCFALPNLIVGGEFVIIGLFLKIVLADNLAPVVDRVFDTPSAYSGINNLVAVFFFSFQIYGDFCGYSLMAIGFARIMGFNLGTNFKRPYLSSSFSELWQRWHISLSSWLRDYLYVTMGGNRGTRLKTLQNLMVTMLLGGLWHGASWTFIAWGALHGAYLVVQRWVGETSRLVEAFNRVPAGIIHVIKTAAVFLCVLIAWVFFRSRTFCGALDVFHQILFGEFGLRSVQLKFQTTLGLAIICLVIIGEIVIERQYWVVLRRNRWIRLAVMSNIVWLTILFGQYSGARFLYFQF